MKNHLFDLSSVFICLAVRLQIGKHKVVVYICKPLIPGDMLWPVFHYDIEKIIQVFAKPLNLEHGEIINNDNF